MKEFRGKEHCVDEATDVRKCYDEFFQRRNGCTLPWRKGTQVGSKQSGIRIFTSPVWVAQPPCETLDHLLALVNASRAISVSSTHRTQSVTGCRPSCRSAQYIPTKFSDVVTRQVAEDGETRTVVMWMPSSSVTVLESVLRYSMDDLVADVGGYLGLLLGGSALTFYDLVLQKVKGAAGKLKKHG